MLAVRPLGLFGGLPVNPNVSRGRLSWIALGVIVLIAALAPLYTTDFFLNVILTKALWLGVAAASLIFVAATAA